MKLVFFLIFMSCAQASVMNLNEYMPTRLEDASPVPVKSIDVDYGVETSRRTTLHRPNIRYGYSERIQLEVEGTYERGAEDLNEIEADILYDFNKSDSVIPEVAISPLIIIPTDGNAWDQQLTLYLSSTLAGTSDEPLFQLHLNVAQTFKARQTTFKFGPAYRLTKNCALVVNYFQRGHQKDFEAGTHIHLGDEYYIGLGYLQLTGKEYAGIGSIVALEKEFD